MCHRCCVRRQQKHLPLGNFSHRILIQDQRLGPSPETLALLSGDLIKPAIEVLKGLCCAQALSTTRMVKSDAPVWTVAPCTSQTIFSTLHCWMSGTTSYSQPSQS